MGLDKYQEKRKFGETPEPKGEARSSEGPLRFVVQKHRASHLHYDFRLEVDGVLKSWAVPKGPSLDPADKRLAMMVEDHPMEYRLFEGTIPKGNYGAGTVMVWDEGTYLPRQPGQSRAEDEAILLEGLSKGRVTVVLEGKKLRGEFALVKLQRGEPNAWLFMKKNDEFASESGIAEADQSVLSNRSMDEIEQQSKRTGEVWLSLNESVEIDLSEFPLSEMPRQIKPMLAKPASEAFDKAGWLFEIKWDGYRTVAEVDGDDVSLYSRTGLSFNDTFAPILRSLQRLGHKAVLDGEVVAIDAQGRPSFQLLQNRENSSEGYLVYYVFDLLWFDGHDLRKAPLQRRKAILAQLLPNVPNIKFSDHLPEQGKGFFEVAKAQGLEGILAKRADSHYMAGRRSDSWLKIKTELWQDAVIGGFTNPKGTRKGFGALIVGAYDGDDLIYIGHIGTGFDELTLARLRAMLETLVQEESPFKTTPPTNGPARWVSPKLVCSICFREWTSEGYTRHAVFHGLKDDVDPRSVHREEHFVASDNTLPAETGQGIPQAAASEPPASSAEIAETPSQPVEDKPAPSEPEGGEPPRRRFQLLKKDDKQIEIDGHLLKLTNLDKIYWPDERYTKGDLIGYYRAVSTYILPYLQNRPESLNRHPHGIRGESFFQKDMADRPPLWVETIHLHSDSQDDSIRYLLCQNEATLVYMANLGCIELNPWHSRTGTLDRPDYMVIDLDPEAVDFKHVVATALKVREVLEKAEAPSVCKTSGSRGLHIYVPLGAEYDYDQTRQLAQLVATVVHQQYPAHTSLVRSPAQRQGKVYLDYLQNRRGQTLAAPYSVRPRAGATVSTPLKWEEVTPKLDPSAFTIRTVLERLDKIGDIWKPSLGPGVDLATFLERVSAAL